MAKPKGHVVAPVMTDPKHSLEKTQAAKAAILRSEGTKATGANRDDLNRKASQAEAVAHSGGFASHKGAAGGPKHHMDDVHSRVKAANKETRAKYDATHRHPIGSGN